jgi:hypothetical protein
MNIRHAGDADAIWRIVEPTIRAGLTYTLDPTMSRDAALRYWMGADREIFVAEQDQARPVRCAVAPPDGKRPVIPVVGIRPAPLKLAYRAPALGDGSTICPTSP